MDFTEKKKIYGQDAEILTISMWYLLTYLLTYTFLLTLTYLFILT